MHRSSSVDFTSNRSFPAHASSSSSSSSVVALNLSSPHNRAPSTFRSAQSMVELSRAPLFVSPTPARPSLKRAHIKLEEDALREEEAEAALQGAQSSEEAKLVLPQRSLSGVSSTSSSVTSLPFMPSHASRPHRSISMVNPFMQPLASIPLASSSPRVKEGKTQARRRPSESSAQMSFSNQDAHPHTKEQFSQLNAHPHRQIIMACYHIGSGASSSSASMSSSQQRIGIAYFEPETQSVFLSSFVDAHALMTRLKHRLQPALILTSARALDSRFQHLACNDLDLSHPFEVRTLKASCFSASVARAKLEQIQLQDDEQLDSSTAAASIAIDDRALMHRSTVNNEAGLAMSAFGALLTHLMQTGVLKPLAASLRPTFTSSSNLHQRASVGNTTYVLKEIQAVPQTGYMQIDDSTTRALGIFAFDRHPGLTARAKEGNSVYATLNSTVTNSGAKLLHSWLANPLCDRHAINERLDRVEALCSLQSLSIIGPLRQALRGIKDVGRLLRVFQSGQPRLHDWQSLSRALKQLSELENIVAQNLPASIVALFARGGSDTRVSLNRLNEEVERWIEFDTTAYDANERSARIWLPQVRQGNDAQLDEMRALYLDLPSFLSSIAREDAQAGKVPLGVAWSLSYVAQLGFLLRCSSQHEAILNKYPQQFEHRFNCGEFAYFKSARCSALDESIGDIQTNIRNLEISLVRSKQQMIETYSPLIAAATASATELDCLCSLAAAAHQLGLVRPILHDTDEIKIEKGWHLIYQPLVEQFVPNDTHFACHRSGGGEVHVITSPNSSGKTIYMKQVALIVWLSHCGCFVPAVSASIGPCDAIFTSLSVNEYMGSSSSSTSSSSAAITNDASSWMIEASRVAYFLRHATGISLGILDEVGRSTNEHDAAALTAALVNELASKASDCSRLLLATHANQIFTSHLLSNSERIRCFCLDFAEIAPRSSSANDCFPQASRSVSDDGSDEHAGVTSISLTRMVPYYRLKAGINRSSFAFACAASAGMPVSMMQRAMQHHQGMMLLPLPAISTRQAMIHEQAVSLFLDLAARGVESASDAEIRALASLLNEQEEEDVNAPSV